MDIRGVEITNQLRSAIRAKLLELGVRYDDELPDYILVMVVNKKSRSQMNEDLNLFLEDSTDTFVNWLHDQVLKKLQKVTVAKKKTNNKDTVSTALVKQEDIKNPKIEDKATIKINTSSKVPTKVERDQEFDELVGDLAMLNDDSTKSVVKQSQINEERSQKSNVATNHGVSYVDSSPKNPERRGLHSSISIPKSSNSEKPTIPLSKSEIDNNTSSNSLKRISTDNLCDETAQNIKRSKISSDSDTENNKRLKSSVIKPKLTSVVSVKSRLGTVSPLRKQELQTKRTDTQYTSSNKIDISSDRNNFNQNKSIERRKPQSECLRLELQKDNRQTVHNLNNEKSNRNEGSIDKERLSSKSVTIKSRLGINSSKKKVLPLTSTNSTKVTKPRVSNVKSRLGVRSKQSDRKILSTVSRLSKISQKHFEEDDDAESVINPSLKSHIIAVPKSRPHKRKQLSLDSVDKPETLIQEKIEEGNNEDDDCKILSKIIVTPRPLKPLKPVQKRATQSLLLKAVAEANQSVVMQKKIDPCLKDQKKAINNIKITRDPWEGKILSVSLNGKKRNVMEKIQVELTNPEKSKKSPSTKKSQVVTTEHMDVVKSLFKRSDDKQKFLVTLNGYNNNVLEEKNSDNEERLDIELIDIDDELSLVDNQYDEYDDEVQVIEINKTNEDQPVSQDQAVPQIQADIAPDTCTETETHRYIEVIDTYSNRYPDTYTERYTDNYADSHLNRYANIHNEKYSDKRPGNYAEQYPDRCANKYSNSRKDNYADPQSDEYADKRQDDFSDPHSDIFTNKYTGIDQDGYEDQHLDGKHLIVQENASKTRRKLSPIVYTRSRSNSSEKKPKVASTITPVLKIDKRPLISSIITTVADKSSEKCRYWPNCTLGIKCAYYHPEVLCSSFPSCKFGEKCAYTHPKCKFGSACTKLGCKFSHPPVKCKYHPYCMKPGCPFSHPKSSSSSSLTQPLTPDITTVRAKFTWKKKE